MTLPAGLLLLTVLLPPSAPATGRIAPPSAVTCPRDHLTAFMGRVSAWERTPARILMKVSTDEATSEKFEIPLGTGSDPRRFFLMEGGPFRPTDWKRIEITEGRLKDPMRAIVWVCDDGSAPLVDFRPPEAASPEKEKEERP